ncbi:MAG: alpha/beta hydrolase [Pseudomonadota bacterium]|nr:alpha/beta hydrolase [Pseudomonadota bacterium]
MGRNLELAIGVLNGTVGDYLARTGNGLATEMAIIHDGAPLRLDPASLARAFPAATRKIVVLLHGLMNTEHVWAFPPSARGADATESTADYGGSLARDHGYTPLYLRYNTGRSIPDNGASLDQLLTALVRAWPSDSDGGPVQELLLVGYSMGGLVVRSACHVAKLAAHDWLPRVHRILYIGTPHLGAPLERVGRVVSRGLRAVPDPYTQLIAQIADLRSDGLKDLGDADLRHEDRARRLHRVSLRDPNHPVPLLPEVRHYLVAGTLSAAPWAASLFGDIMVPVPSGTASTSELPPERVAILPGMSHVALAHHPAVYRQIHAWMANET